MENVRFKKESEMSNSPNIFSVWFRVVGILLSFCAFLYTVTEYHILLDGLVSQHKRQIKLVPFFTVNFLFRSLALSLFWVYWKVIYMIISIYQSMKISGECSLGQRFALDCKHVAY
jgi:hypothetical protein